MIEQNYKGFLLAAHPKRPEPFLRRGVILVIDHDKGGAIGLQLNKPFTNDISFQTVMDNVGLSYPGDAPLYVGGQEATNRIHVVHSLDWYTGNTVKITETLGVSHDVSILTALSKNDGPEHFRVMAGFTRWLPGHLEGEILGEAPWNITQSWSFVPATNNLIFNSDDLDQWHTIISESSKLQVSNWF